MYGDVLLLICLVEVGQRPIRNGVSGGDRGHRYSYGVKELKGVSEREIARALECLGYCGIFTLSHLPPCHALRLRKRQRPADDGPNDCSVDLVGTDTQGVMYTMLAKGRWEFEEQTREHIYEYAADAGLRTLFLLTLRSTKNNTKNSISIFSCQELS
ncbi:hypothetical protein V2J09_022540 [Rumex salicifolius]